MMMRVVQQLSLCLLELLFHHVIICDSECVCVQRGSNYGSLMTADGNLQIFAKTGYYKVSVASHHHHCRQLDG